MRKKGASRPRLNCSDDLDSNSFYHNEFNLIIPTNEDDPSPLMDYESKLDEEDVDEKEVIHIGLARTEESIDNLRDHITGTPREDGDLTATSDVQHLLQDMTLDDVTINGITDVESDDDSYDDTVTFIEGTSLVLLSSNDDLNKKPPLFLTEEEKKDDGDDTIVDDWNVLLAMETWNKKSNETPSTQLVDGDCDWDAVSSVQSVLSMDTLQSCIKQEPPSLQSYKDVLTKNQGSIIPNNNLHGLKPSSDKSFSREARTEEGQVANCATSTMLPIIENEYCERDDSYDEREGYKFCRGGKETMMFCTHDNRRGNKSVVGHWKVKQHYKHKGGKTTY